MTRIWGAFNRGGAREGSYIKLTRRRGMMAPYSSKIYPKNISRFQISPRIFFLHEGFLKPPSWDQVLSPQHPRASSRPRVQCQGRSNATGALPFPHGRENQTQIEGGPGPFWGYKNRRPSRLQALHELAPPGRDRPWLLLTTAMSGSPRAELLASGQLDVSLDDGSGMKRGLLKEEISHASSFRPCSESGREVVAGDKGPKGLASRCLVHKSRNPASPQFVQVRPARTHPSQDKNSRQIFRSRAALRAPSARRQSAGGVSASRVTQQG